MTKRSNQYTVHFVIIYGVSSKMVHLYSKTAPIGTSFKRYDDEFRQKVAVQST